MDNTTELVNTEQPERSKEDLADLHKAITYILVHQIEYEQIPSVLVNLGKTGVK